MKIIEQLDKLVLSERSNLESKPWHSGVPCVVTEGVDIEQIVTALENNHFETGWLLSYKEQGTIINARRPNGTDNKGRQRQLHCRARAVKVNSNTALQWACHTEYSPIQHPQLHIDGTDLSWDEGQNDFYSVVSNIDSITASKYDANWKPDSVIFS